MLQAPQVSISDILVNQNEILATSTGGAISEGKVFRSTDDGVVWETIFEYKQPLNSITQDISGTIIVGASGDGTFGSVGGGVWWIKVSGMKNTFITSMHHDDVSDNVKVTTLYGGAHETTDRGKTWNNKSFNLPNAWVNASDVSSVTNTWVVNTTNGNYRLESGSENWQPTGGFYNGIKADNPGNFYGWSGPNIYRSTDDAITFNFFTAAPYLISNLEFNNSGDMLAATNNQSGTGTGIYLFNGNNWNEMNNGLTDWDVTVLKKLNLTVSASYCISDIVCATKNGKYFALDESNNWNESSTGLPNQKVNDIVALQMGVVAFFVDILLDAELYRLDDDCIFNNDETFPATAEVKKALYIAGNRLESKDNSGEAIGFYGTNGSGILKKDLLVGVKTVETIIPDKFSLEQNYPNPFNPSTTIKFALPKESFTKLEIFSALGEKVSTLVSENLSAGTYEYEWNAAGLPSGVYFYRLSAGEYSDTKKLILLR